MITVLQSTSLQDLIHKPVLFDANIFMVAIDRRKSDKNYSFENMKQLYITPLFESFKKIYVHEEVYNELDDEMKALIDSYIGVNVTKVKEDDLYGRDPKYTTIFNHIAQHELFYPQLGVKLCSMAGGGVQKIYMVFLREPSRRDRSGSDLFHLRDGFEIKMNFDRNVSCFIFVNALMHDDFFD